MTFRTSRTYNDTQAEATYDSLLTGSSSAEPNAGDAGNAGNAGHSTADLDGASTAVLMPMQSTPFSFGMRAAGTAAGVHLHRKAPTEVVMEQEMEDMQDCDDPAVTAKAQELWDRIKDDSLPEIRENESFMVNSDIFETEGMDWGQSMTKILPRLMCFLRNEFATVERCAAELKCCTEDYRCLSEQKAQCAKRKQEESAKPASQKDPCLLYDLKMEISRTQCEMVALEQKARDCRKKIKDARKNLNLLGGAWKGDRDQPKEDLQWTFGLDGALRVAEGKVPSADHETNYIGILGEKLPAEIRDVGKGDRPMPTTNDKPTNDFVLGGAASQGYLFDVFYALLKARLVENERTFFQEIRRMRLEELIAEAKLVQQETEEHDRSGVHCPYSCTCTHLAPVGVGSAGSGTVGSAAVFVQTDNRRLFGTGAGAVSVCRCGARGLFEKWCRKRQELRRQLQVDPAAAFAMDDDKLMEYIRVEVFGEPKENFENVHLRKMPFFQWFSVFVLEIEKSIEDASKVPDAMKREKVMEEAKNKETDPTKAAALKMSWRGMDFFKNVLDFSSKLRSRSDCCLYLQPRKLVAECLLNAQDSGCFIQCCPRGREVFEKVYCDQDTGSLALLCQFVSDFLLAARNVPMSASVCGQALVAPGGLTVKSEIFHSSDATASDDRKHSMRIAQSDLLDPALQMEAYWPRLATGLIFTVAKFVFFPNAAVRTYSQEMDRNYFERVRGICSRIAKASNQIGGDQEPFLYLHASDFRILRALKEHRMIGGTAPTVVDADNVKKWDPYVSAETAAEAHVSHFESLPSNMTFWHEMTKLGDAVTQQFKDDVDKTDAQDNSVRSILQLSIMRIALEGFKDQFDLSQLKTFAVNAGFFRQLQTAKDFNDEVKDKFFVSRVSEDINLFFAKNDDDANASMERFLNPKYLNEELEYEVEYDSRSVIPAKWKAESAEKLQQLAKNVGRRMSALWDTFDLKGQNPVDGTVSNQLYGMSSHVPAPTAHLAGSSYWTEANEPKDQLASREYKNNMNFIDTNRFDNTGRGERYDYYSQNVLCNRELDCDFFAQVNPQGHTQLSENERERREDGLKVLGSLLDILNTWHAPRQHWGAYAKAVQKVINSIGC
mmetsp:Transcript_4617/g.7317  ORF Transcript_4617/g.7317 Transcript_4617/m.7317 type:complete len:1117 (-) Transcript_4617:318-3668(-)|eukprot:CAMPEP_0175164282 /NCGR_PEP_ID=MMETSP0087-20121206/26313_1 /TAXON_ID=136419 /ORGANISM="Unknown Unknown, Strain D1" /LENGTH=1116 /DNA_ID=CAMNT_0016453269 /DNA_START=10 /DNA_END=3360 /DNA_ORIENTATION=-